jgi:uncharacterized membrane protein
MSVEPDEYQDIDLTPQPVLYRKSKFDRKYFIHNDPRLSQDTVSIPKKIILYIYLSLKMGLSIFGSVLMWVGIWDLLERPYNHTWWTEVVTIILGVIFFVVLMLIFRIPFLKKLTEGNKWYVIGHVMRFIRDFSAVTLSVAIWKSGYNLLEYYTWEDTYLRASLYTFCGFMAMLGTATLSENTAV